MRPASSAMSSLGLAKMMSRTDTNNDSISSCSGTAKELSQRGESEAEVQRAESGAKVQRGESEAEVQRDESKAEVHVAEKQIHQTRMSHAWKHIESGCSIAD